MLPKNPATLSPPWRHLPHELMAYMEYRRMPSLSQLQNWPRGNDRPVLVIPGFGQSASTTEALRACLKQQGFLAYDWGLGKNKGLKPGMTSQLLQTIEQIEQQHEQAPILVGWSLGGIIARELARKKPQHVARVISLGSPIAGPQSTTIQTLFALMNGKAKTSDGFNAERYQPPPVPCTAIFTRQDGVVNWQASLEPEYPQSENIEVQGTHLGLGFNPQVWHAICHRSSPQTEHTTYLKAQ